MRVNCRARGQGHSHSQGQGHSHRARARARANRPGPEPNGKGQGQRARGPGLLGQWAIGLWAIGPLGRGRVRPRPPRRWSPRRSPTRRRARRPRRGGTAGPGAEPWPISAAVFYTDILHVSGFDSSRVLFSRGDIFKHTGGSPGNSTQRILVCELSVCKCDRLAEYGWKPRRVVFGSKKPITGLS